MPYLCRISMVIFLSFFLIENTFAKAEQLQISHPSFSEPLVFNVNLPANYGQKTTKFYPLMFDFHPHSQSYLKGMHDWMSHNGEWPWLQTIIVTPAHGNPVGKLFDVTGKSTPLLDFFEQNLFTKIDNKYRTNNFKIMSGFRVNGTLLLSALINKPNLANAYIVTSPELNGDLAAILSTSKEKLAKLDKKPRFLYLSHGNTIKEDHQMASYKALYKILEDSAPKSLDWHFQDNKEHYFMSLPLLSTIAGIELLFDDIHRGLDPTGDISKAGVVAISKHYQYLTTEKYGFEVSPKTSIKNRAFYLVDKGEKKGIEVLKEYVNLYPDDAYSYHYLAKGYAQLGEHSLAIKNQEKAVKMSKNMLTWHQKRISKQLEEFKKTNRS